MVLYIPENVQENQLITGKNEISHMTSGHDNVHRPFNRMSKQMSKQMRFQERRGRRGNKSTHHPGLKPQSKGLYLQLLADFGREDSSWVMSDKLKERRK